MVVREARQAGINELTIPISRAADMQIKPTPGLMLKVRIAGMKFPPGLLRIAAHIPDASKHPTAPPIAARTADSPSTMPSTALGVKPRVFKIPTSRIRSRTDMEIVLADTSKIVNVTAPQMAMINNLTFPRKATKLSWNCFSDSVLVGKGEVENRLSIAA